jgi:hypothetical protein
VATVGTSSVTDALKHSPSANRKYVITANDLCRASDVLAKKSLLWEHFLDTTKYLHRSAFVECKYLLVFACHRIFAVGKHSIKGIELNTIELLQSLIFIVSALSYFATVNHCSVTFKFIPTINKYLTNLHLTANYKCVRDLFGEELRLCKDYINTKNYTGLVIHQQNNIL